MIGITIFSCKKSTVVPAPSISSSATLQGGSLGKVAPPPKRVNNQLTNQIVKKSNQRPPLPKHLQEKREFLEKKQDEISSLGITFIELSFANKRNANEIGKIEKLLNEYEQPELGEVEKDQSSKKHLTAELRGLKAIMKKNERELLRVEQDLANVSQEHSISRQKYISEVEKYYSQIEKQSSFEEK